VRENLTRSPQTPIWGGRWSCVSDAFFKSKRQRRKSIICPKSEFGASGKKVLQNLKKQKWLNYFN
jgi:hypothetical protein